MNKPLQKRQKIIETAIKLFVKNGIHNTPMQTLAKKAGVSTGSIYTYFDNKEAIIVDIFHAIAEESTTFMTAEYVPEQPIKSRFYYLMQRKIRFNIDHPHKFRFMGMCVYEPIIMKTVQNDRCETSPLAAVLTDAKAENLIKNLPLEDLFYHIFGGVASLLEWRLFNHQTLSDTDITNMIDMAWDGIKA